MSWDRPFHEPVFLPNGAPARTLRDAGNYIRELPKSVHDSKEWRLAVHMLIDAAEGCGPMVFARMGMVLAIERDAEPRFESAWRQVKVIPCRRRNSARYR